MRGGTQSQLMLGSDGNLWVVKFTNNPQHSRILANELIVGRIAHFIGLTVPKCSPILVDQRTILSDPQLKIQFANGMTERCADGIQFGSQYIGGTIQADLPEELEIAQSRHVLNSAEFPCMFAMDRWTGNGDRRQMVFKALLGGRGLRAFFIDHGGCFGAGDWSFGDGPLPWGQPRTILFASKFNWNSFEPWLSRIEAFPEKILWDIADSVPAAWYGNDRYALENLIEQLLKRRALLRWHTLRDWTSHRASIRDL